jgi:prepilin-type N-terminal cleavage/methylation domain-containing protein
MGELMGVETIPTRAREDGFSLIELIVVMAMLTVALGSILTVVERTTRISNEDRERAHAIRTVQVELEGVVREVRQSFRINASTDTRLDVSVYRGGTTRRLVFDCSVPHPTMAGTRRCTRQEMLADGSLTAARVAIDRVRNTTVFTYTPATGVTNHVAINVEVPASGELRQGRNHLIRLSDGFAVRNRGLVP